MKFATYLHSHTVFTSQPSDQIEFAGHSYPHFSQVRQELEVRLKEYPVLSIREAEFSDYETVHSKEYIQALRQMALGEVLENPPKLSIECKGLEHCLPGYLYGLGGLMEAIDEMAEGVLQRAYCFSLGGHHAYADWGHGYCLLNPSAAAAKYAQQRGFKKVLIVDWDLHHGDGTQSIFAKDPQVHCISIHSAADLYMAVACGLRHGTTQAGEALGHQNIPILAKSFDDDFATQMGFEGKFYRAKESLSVFRRSLEQLPWSPDLMMIFSGYDSHRDDHGRDVTDWTDEDFVALTRSVVDLANQSSCPVLSVHGGGYNLPVTVSAARAHVEVLADYQGAAT